MPKITSTIHNHTTFCDGRNTPEEMVLGAIAKGIKTIGFSAHSYTPCDDSYCLKDTDGYFSELSRLKQKYKDQITILSGLEVDCYGDDDARADYVIVSVHNVKTPSGIYVVDYSQQELARCVQEDFGGDVYALVEAYYNTVLESLGRDRLDVVGHLDLVTKFNDQLPLIDTAHPRYVSAVNKVLDALNGRGIPLEVNTGGVYRGYKHDYYPSTELIKMIVNYDIPLLVSTDAHNVDGLDYKLDEATEHLKGLGIKSIVMLESTGFVNVEL